MSQSAPTIQVVTSATHLEIELLRRPSPEVQFGSPEEESAYLQADMKLADRIEAMVQRNCGGWPVSHLLHTSGDWWPNRSRTVTLSSLAVSPEVIAGLQALLVGEYADWRIHAYVQESLDGGSSQEVGSMCVLAREVVIERGLFERMHGVA